MVLIKTKGKKTYNKRFFKERFEKSFLFEVFNISLSHYRQQFLFFVGFFCALPTICDSLIWLIREMFLRRSV